MKKTKLVPITSLDQLEVGSVIVDKDGDRKTILAKSGMLIWSSFMNMPNLPCPDPLTLMILQFEKSQLEVTEEPWVPKKGDKYYLPSTNKNGCSDEVPWSDDEYDRHYLQSNLVCKTKEEALAKAQKMLDSIKDSE